MSGHKATKQKLLSKPSFDTSFLTKLMRFTNSFYFATHWRNMANRNFQYHSDYSTPLHIPWSSTFLGHPTVRISEVNAKAFCESFIYFSYKMPWQNSPPSTVLKTISNDLKLEIDEIEMCLHKSSKKKKRGM